MRSRSACAAVVLLALVATQVSASDVINIWKYPQAKDRNDVYPATCKLAGKATANVQYSPLSVRIGNLDPITNVPTFYNTTPSCFDPTDPSKLLLPGADFPLGQSRISCKASVPEIPNYNATLDFTITLTDQTPPVISVAKPTITLNALPKAPAQPPFNTLSNVAITDDCDDNPVVICVPGVGATFSIGSTLVTCSGKDNAGNEAVPVTYTVVVVDVTAPELPTDLTSEKVIVREADGPEGNLVPELGTYVATDNIDGQVQVVCDKGPSFLFPVNSTTLVTCTASDKANNTATGSITVKIVDTTAPTIVISDPKPIEATTLGGDMPFDLKPRISVEDFKKVDPNPTVSCVPALDPTPIFSLGTTTVVTCTATDKYGNANSTSTKVTVQDTTAPDMPTPVTPFLEIFLDDTTSGTIKPFPNATDVVWGSIPLVCTPAVGSKLPLTGDIVNVKCSATDGSGNTANETYPVKVVRPPSVLTLTVPANQTLNATNGPAGSPFPFTISGTDSLDKPDLTLKCVDPAPSPALTVIDTSSSTSPVSATVNRDFALGTTVIVCTLTNRVGTTDTKAFQVTVSDQTKPVVTGTDWTQEATGPLTPIVYNEKTSLAATDDITPKQDLPINCTGLPAGDPPAFPVGATPITCTTTDGAGNQAIPITVTVTVVDSTPPACPALDIQPLYSVDPSVGQLIPRSAFAPCKDLVDGENLTYACTPDLPTNLTASDPPVNVTIFCSATDKSNNTATVNATTVVIDGQPPELLVPANIEEEAKGPNGNTITFTVVGRTTTNKNLPVTVSCDSTTPFAGTDTGAPGAGASFTGLFGPVSSVADPIPINCTASTTNPVNGKTTTRTFTITILDRTGPIVDQLPDITVQAPVTGDVTVTLPTPKVTDEPTASPVDPNPTVTCTYGPGPVSFAYTPDPITVTCTGKDKFGNNGAPMTYKIIITKGAVPDLQCPSNIRVALSRCQAYASVNYTVTVVNGTAPVCTPAAPVKVVVGSPVTVFCSSTNRFGVDKCNFTITAADGVPPVVYTPCDIIREGCVLGGFYLTPKDLKAYAIDNIDGRIPANCTWHARAGVKYEIAKNRYLFPVGTTQVFCRARDSSGNLGSKAFNVIITDTRKPNIYTNLCVRTYCAPTAAGATIEFNPTAYDVVSGSVAVNVSIDGGAPFKAPATKTLSLGKHTITYSAVDAVGNKQVTTIRNLPVVDCEPPKITPPTPPNGNMYFYYDATSQQGIRIPNLPACTATDNITPASKLVISYTPSAGVLFRPGANKVICSTSDEAGNYASAYYMIFVKVAQHHCNDAYRYSADLHPSCGLSDKFKKHKEAVELRKSSFEICSCQYEVDRHISKSWVQGLVIRSPRAWSSCLGSYNKAKLLTGCGRSIFRKRMMV